MWVQKSLGNAAACMQLEKHAAWKQALPGGPQRDPSAAARSDFKAFCPPCSHAQLKTKITSELPSPHTAAGRNELPDAILPTVHAHSSTEMSLCSELSLPGSEALLQCWVLLSRPPGQAAAGGAPSITLSPCSGDLHSVDELTVLLGSMGPFIKPLLIND